MLKFSGCSCLSSGRIEKCLYIYIRQEIHTYIGLPAGRLGCRHRLQDNKPTYQVVALRRGRRSSLCASTDPRHSFEKRNGVRRPGPILAILLVGEQNRGGAPTLRQTCPRPKPRAQGAFKTSMVHGILQFTRRIAFRCVLHRYGSQDIRC